MRSKLTQFLLPSILTCACSGEITGTNVSPDSTGTDAMVQGSVGPRPSGTPSTDANASVAVPGVSVVVDIPPPSSAMAGVGQPSGTDLEGFPVYTRFSRLTNSQWANSVKQLLMLSTVPNTDPFEDPVAEASYFLNNERLLEVTSTQHDAYELLTETLMEQISTDAALAKIYTGTDAAGFIESFGRRAYRRPLTSAESASLEEVFNAGAALPGTESEFVKGATLVIQTVLQSPYFIYRVEAGQANQQLDGFEVAAKLSLWLLDSAPSDTLLNKANTLTTSEAVVAEARSMLEQPAAAEVMREFFFEWMDLERYNDVNKDPEFNLPEGYAEELKELSTRYFSRIFSEDLGLKEMLTGTQGFVGPKTAALYGVQANTIQLKDFGAARTGYFAQVPYTLLYGSYGGQSDIIHRGAHLQRDVLCGVLDPPESAFSLPEAQPNQSNRERVETMTSAESCVHCHGDFINPLGFAFENFDGLGRIRTEDNNAAVNTTGAYPFPEQSAQFSDHKKLMEAAFASSMSHVCFAKRVASFGLGRDIVAGDEALLEGLASASIANASLKEMVVALVRTPSFLQRTAEGTP